MGKRGRDIETDGERQRQKGGRHPWVEKITLYQKYRMRDMEKEHSNVLKKMMRRNTS